METATALDDRTITAEVETQTARVVKTVEWFDDRFYKILFSNAEAVFYPSVTTILGAINKPYLARWRGEVGNELADAKMNEAARRGSEIHHACAILASGGAVHWVNNDRRDAGAEDLKLRQLAEYAMLSRDSFHVFRRNQEEWIQVYRFFQLLNLVKPKTKAIEKTLFSVEHEIAGTMDFLWEIAEGDYLISGKTPTHIKAGNYVVDLKTGAAINDEHNLQLGAYAAMAKAQLASEIAGTIIVHTNAATRTGIEGLKLSIRNSGGEIEKDFEDFLAVQKIWKRTNESINPKAFELPISLQLTRES